MSAREKHDAVEVIIAKRDGGELSDSQVDWVVDAYTLALAAVALLPAATGCATG